ncbi:MAG: hypothetical protein V4539_16985 [Bacteroidota bacterium]
MDTENISALSAMLIRAGFEEGIGYRLMQRICFRPSNFILVERLPKNKDMLTCLLHIERNGAAYNCGYYDVSLIKGIVMPERVENGINLQEIDLAMGDIDWRFQADDSAFRLSDPSTWERERNISQVVGQLTKLSATEEGKHFADALKLKHWADAGFEGIIGNLNAIRAKFEISQRVYFIDGEAIPVGEAYRFLLNKWMEKKIQAKKRYEAAKDPETGDLGENVVKGKKLVQKKIRERRKSFKIGRERL